MVSTRRRAAAKVEESGSDSDAPEEVSLKSGKQAAIAQKHDERTAKQSVVAAKKEQAKKRASVGTDAEAPAATAQPGDGEQPQQVLEPPAQKKAKKAAAAQKEPPAQPPNEPEEDLLPEDLLASLEQKAAQVQQHSRLEQDAAKPGKPSKRQLKKQKLQEAKKGIVTVKVLGKRLEGNAVHTNPLSEMLMQRKRSYDMLLPAKQMFRPSKKFV